MMSSHFYREKSSDDFALSPSPIEISRSKDDFLPTMPADCTQTDETTHLALHEELTELKRYAVGMTHNLHQLEHRLDKIRARLTDIEITFNAFRQWVIGRLKGRQKIKDI